MGPEKSFAALPVRAKQAVTIGPAVVLPFHGKGNYVRITDGLFANMN
jgi:hypothetical protein